MAKRAPKSDLSASEAPVAEARPPRLDEIIGQRSALALLEGSMRSGRLHHAWIFHGPAGVGKFTAARAFGTALLTPTFGLGDPEPTAPADLHVINKELAAVSSDADTRRRKQLNIPVEVLREFLIGPAARARVVQSASAAGKVFIVDQAELMALAGQNAILKTLEEPPEGTVIILVTSDEDRLLPTIRSRSQRVGFSPLAAEEMAKWAKTGLSDDLPKAERDWLLSYAEGSPGAAADARKHGLYSWHEVLEPLLAKIDRGQFSAELGSAMSKLVDERAEAAVKGAKEASKEAANRYWSKLMLGFVARRAATRLRGGAGAQGLGVALQTIERLGEAERAIDANVRFADVLDNLAAQMA